MLSNVGHTIQKMVNNSPVAITANETSTAVVTNGGSVFQAGFLGGRVQPTFREVFTDGNVVGRIVDAEATENKIYLLTASGSVFEYEYNSCGPLVREVYSPAACGGDEAIKIKAGRAHVLILTKCNKVWGAGNNEEYQLVPQGQCRYDTAVEIFVTDVNIHDNNCCSAFTGTLSELEHPVIPVEKISCKQVSCVKDTLCDVHLGYFNINGVTVTSPGTVGILGIPVFGDISFVGFLCVDKHGCATGSISFRLTKLYIKCGCGLAKFTYPNGANTSVCELNISSTSDVIIFESDKCNGIPPVSGSAYVSGKCGSCVEVDLDLSLTLPSTSFDFACNTLIITLENQRTSIAVLCDGLITALSSNFTSAFDLNLNVKLDCCETECAKSEVHLPQPCWTNIFAGHDISILVDNCNRIYAFGSLHQIRSNKDLLRRSCLEELLKQANASVTFPADQLNCSNHDMRHDNCKCPKHHEKPFKTDLNKFGIHLNFPNGVNDDECEEKQLSVCDFLKNLKRCNELENCSPTCEPCDSDIYLNIAGNCGCSCSAQPAPHIGSVTLFNKRSICKLVSQGFSDHVNLDVTIDSFVEFDLNRYCVDAREFSLDKIVKLNFCVNKGPNVNIYLDLDQAGGIRFTINGKKCNVEFTVNANTPNRQFLLNYGSVMDPTELTNLKYSLSLDCHFPCPKFKNPFDTKITNTYLRGGDRVKFVITNPNNIRQAVTADVATIFRFSKRVIDVGVGHNTLTVLVGGLACPNEVLALGSNCHGELGLDTNESVVCFKQINRCLFDCQVIAVFAHKFVTFYITQSYSVYASGLWKNLVNSHSPELVKTICKSWRVGQIAISNNHIVLLSSDGCIFGLGDNSLGELGLSHTDNACKPTPLTFFYKLNSRAAKQLCDNLSNPYERKYKHGKDDSDSDSDCDKKKSFPRKYVQNGRCSIKRGKY